MGFLSSLLGFLGFGTGIGVGLLIGYYFFIYFQPTDVKVGFLIPFSASSLMAFFWVISSRFSTFLAFFLEGFVIDLQVFATPRITLKPLVPSFPCFAKILVSLMEKFYDIFTSWTLLQPHVDFGLKLLGADVMSVPGLYRFVQETIKKQVANMYLWPKTLEVPIMDPSK
ncbi:hypothetical protein BHE74_00054216 [Ensete ventricosum]|nr:hypothetical protein BHE74_00054216 [Ensete ventricosum]